MAEIEVDLTNYKDKFGSRVEPGVYTVTVEDAQKAESRAGNQMIEVWFRVQGGEFDGATITDRLTMTENAMFRVVAFLAAVGIPTPRKRLMINTATLIGKRLQIDVVDGEPFKNKVKSEVTDYIKIAGGGAAAATDLEDLETTEATPEDEAQSVTVPAVSEPEQVDLDSLEDL